VKSTASYMFCPTPDLSDLQLDHAEPLFEFGFIMNNVFALLNVIRGRNEFKPLHYLPNPVIHPFPDIISYKKDMRITITVFYVQLTSILCSLFLLRSMDIFLFNILTLLAQLQ